MRRPVRLRKNQAVGARPQARRIHFNFHALLITLSLTFRQIKGDFLGRCRLVSRLHQGHFLDKLKVRAGQLCLYCPRALHQAVRGFLGNLRLAEISQWPQIDIALHLKGVPIPQRRQLIFSRRKLGLGQIEIQGIVRCSHLHLDGNIGVVLGRDQLPPVRAQQEP